MGVGGLVVDDSAAPIADRLRARRWSCRRPVEFRKVGRVVYRTFVFSPQWQTLTHYISFSVHAASGRSWTGVAVLVEVPLYFRFSLPNIPDLHRPVIAATDEQVLVPAFDN